MGLKLAAPLFYPAVLLSAWFGGFSTGLLSTVLSAATIAYFWTPPIYSFVIADVADVIGLAIFLGIGLLMSALGDRRLRHATALLAAVRRSEQRYRDLFARNPAGILVSRRDGTVLESNDAFARLLGYGSPEEVRAHNVREFYLDPKDHDTFLARLRPGTVTGSRDVQWRRRDGTPVWVLLHTREEEGGVVESIAIDVSDRRRSEHAER